MDPRIDASGADRLEANVAFLLGGKHIQARVHVRRISVVDLARVDAGIGQRLTDRGEAFEDLLWSLLNSAGFRTKR